MKIIDEVVRYFLRQELAKHERAEARVERKRRRALRRRRERLVMFEDPEYANKHISRLFRGHSEKLRIETRLTIY
jgi:hypothetical protein